MGAHTTSDDPTRYRLAAELETWKLKDPIERVKAYLSRSGAGDTEFFARSTPMPTRWPPTCAPAARALPTPSRSTLFDHVYAGGSSLLDEERGRCLRTSRRSPERGTDMTTLTLGRAINEGMRKAMEDDDKVLIMGEDVGRLGGVFRVTDGLQKDFGEDRVIDTPLAESGIIGTAIGLAIRGFRPVCEIQFDGFVFPAFDQIVSQVAKMHYRSAGKSRSR